MVGSDKMEVRKAMTVSNLWMTILLIAATLLPSTTGFQLPPKHALRTSSTTCRLPAPITILQKPHTSTVALFSQNDDYSRDVRLREEAESPFRRVRFFLYAVLGGGAVTSLFLSLARIAAASSGVNTDLMQESVVNAGVDLAGIVVLTFLFQRDVQAQDSRLKRATKGASLAKLAIRVHKGLSDPLLWEDNDNNNDNPKASYTSLTLADLRRNRGIEKRVVIAAAGPDKMDQVLAEARSVGDALEENDLVIVPVVLPLATAPAADNLPHCVALPVGTSAWKAVLDDETQEARSQGVDIEAEGICVILKKNGRVGQRTRGIFLERMVGEVEERREMGMDVTNI
ncbi:Protein of unknown function (DUF3493) [Seminavis robusta]|uniref:Uncharacterized protein n=1 Tax=Seminavis robusta TaxID=568900 RepID=A0A9N8E4C8_9STRA|nr:Protein of unknown function (DUF3493) [Seminavis robusta]|eukprot:Sro652_g181730.1 Protein of unknown function (DUF3493) (342) ;mRNA; r:16368-17393